METRASGAWSLFPMSVINKNTLQKEAIGTFQKQRGCTQTLWLAGRQAYASASVVGICGNMLPPPQGDSSLPVNTTNRYCFYCLQTKTVNTTDNFHLLLLSSMFAPWLHYHWPQKYNQEYGAVVRPRWKNKRMREKGVFIYGPVPREEEKAHIPVY